jgi:signal peptidase I
MSRRQNQSPPSSSQENIWLEIGKTIGLSLIFAFGIRTFAAQAFNVSSGSMEPTLEVSDKFLVDKVTYRLQTPQRGDIVVFSPTQQLVKENFHDNFVKRVIGLPGDKVELKDGKVYVNSKPLPENKYLNAKQLTTIDVCPLEYRPYLAKPVTIPPNSYLVLGDNRMNSYDGRCWGVVPKENIVGRAIVRFFPLNHLRGLNN